MVYKTLDFGGLWVSDPDQLEAITKPGRVVLPTLLIFCRGGFMMRVNFDVDFEANQVEKIKYSSQLYAADRKMISFRGTDEDDREIEDVEWRFREGGLEFRDATKEWFRYIPVTEEFLTEALSVPPPFFDSVRRGASAGGFEYSEQPILPGHQPTLGGARKWRR